MQLGTENSSKVPSWEHSLVSKARTVSPLVCLATTRVGLGYGSLPDHSTRIIVVGIIYTMAQVFATPLYPIHFLIAWYGSTVAAQYRISAI